MAKKVKEVAASEVKFGQRCQFNSGFHDATNGVQQGWAVPERNFGFGPALSVKEPEDVLTQHFSKFYAEGWIRGYRWQVAAGKEAESPSSSEPAWLEFTGQ